MKITLKNVIGINQQFDEGIIINEGSLAFALSSIQKSQDWMEQVACLLRALLIDHAFRDGNKRTATAILLSALERQKFSFHPEEIPQLTLKISKNNIRDIKAIKKEITLLVY